MNKDQYVRELEAEILELKKYKAFHDHIASHEAVKRSPMYPGQVMCKICNKTFNQITEATQNE